MLGFVKKTDLPAGDFRWLTVVSPDAVDGVELVLEPNQHPAAKTYQAALYAEGIPLTAFAVDDCAREYARMKGLGVRFSVESTKTEDTTIAIFDDTCGNYMQIYQV